MINEKNFENALDDSSKENNHEEVNYKKDNKDEYIEDYKEHGLDLEKNDVFAMLIGAFIVVIPSLLVFSAIIIAVVWFFYYR